MEYYRILIPKKAAKQLEALPRNILKMVHAKLRTLGSDPRPTWAKQLKGSPPGWRFRVGDYRVLYDVNDNERSVVVRAAGHRREVYRRR